MIVWSNTDIFSTSVSTLNGILFYLLEGLPRAAFISGYLCSKTACHHFLRGAMNGQILKASKAAQNAARLVLRKRTDGFGLTYSVVKFFANYP